jgi:hypothetical protein
MLAQGAYSATSLEIIDNGRKIKTVLALGTYWSNQYGPKAGKFGDPWSRQSVHITRLSAVRAGRALPPETSSGTHFC